MAHSTMYRGPFGATIEAEPRAGRLSLGPCASAAAAAGPRQERVERLQRPELELRPGPRLAGVPGEHLG